MNIKAISMGIAFALMWSSAFSSARIIVEFAPPMTSLALRFLVSGVIGVLIARYMGQTARLTSSQWRSTFVFGICQNALYLGVFFYAMQTIEASLAAIIAATMPLIVALLGWAFLGERPRPLGMVGLVAGIVGVAVIMGARLEGGVDTFGLGICAIGVIALAVATLSVRGASSGGNLMMIVGLQMLVGSAILTVPAVLFETWDVEFNRSLILAFCYTVFVPGLLATFIWFMLVQRIGAVKSATFHFLNPFFGVAIAAVLLGEHIGALDYVGVAIIAGGILAVQLSKQRT